MNAKDLLIEAKNLINISGWKQGEYGGEDQGFCTFGALVHADADGDFETHSAAAKALRQALKDSGYITNVVAWNDAETRTKDQVLDIFDKAVSYV